LRTISTRSLAEALFCPNPALGLSLTVPFYAYDTLTGYSPSLGKSSKLGLLKSGEIIKSEGSSIF
jgi:hypothetical protein